MRSIVRHIERQWYHNLTWLQYGTLLEKIFVSASALRKYIYRARAYHSHIPVWVIGNISVGGNGKTPFVIWLATRIMQQGYPVQIVAHGYRANLPDSVALCYPNSDPNLFGDEAVMLANQLDMTVVVAKKRIDAVQYIEATFPETRVILCDDGLQHYQLGRNKELVLVDKKRLGNARCLPVGPLREPLSRLQHVDLCLYHGGNADNDLHYQASHYLALDTQQCIPLKALVNQQVHAVAGIAQPDRFFTLLESLGMIVIRHPFPDHHHFCATDCTFSDNLPVIMTTKDAVKCQPFVGPDFYALVIDVVCADRTITQVDALITSLATC